MTVYIVSKGTAGNGKGISVETFVLEKVTNEDRSGQRLSKMFEFMYLIKDLCIEDSGKYEYTITLACGHTKTGTITISVVGKDIFCIKSIYQVTTAFEFTKV